MKSFNLLGFAAVLLAVSGAVISIGQFFENKFIGWSFIGAGLALAIFNTWWNTRKHKR